MRCRTSPVGCRRVRRDRPTSGARRAAAPAVRGRRRPPSRRAGNAPGVGGGRRCAEPRREPPACRTAPCRRIRVRTRCAGSCDMLPGGSAFALFGAGTAVFEQPAVLLGIEDAVDAQQVGELETDQSDRRVLALRHPLRDRLPAGGVEGRAPRPKGCRRRGRRSGAPPDGGRSRGAGRESSSAGPPHAVNESVHNRTVGAAGFAPGAQVAFEVPDGSEMGVKRRGCRWWRRAQNCPRWRSR